MDADELLRRWEAAGAASAGEPPGGDGLLGLRPADDAAALTGAALVALGLPLNDDPARPGDVRRASRAYGGWLPAFGERFRAADYGDVDIVTDDLAVAFMQAHERLADIVAAGGIPLVLGGDGLVTVPVLQVLSGKLHGRLGIVAFTPAYDIAPEPLYAAGSRWARALELGVVAPANIVLVGGREAPPDVPARRVLDELGATAFSQDEVVRDGMPAVAQEALELAAHGTEALYLSVDVGVVAGMRDPVGLTARELTTGVRVVASALLAAADVCGSGPGRGSSEGPAVAARTAAEISAGVAARFA
jgi:arginase family enzyme